MDRAPVFKQIEAPEEAIRQSLENEQSTLQRFTNFVQRSPFLIAGMLGFTAIGIIGARQWKNRKVSPSLYLIQLRVLAQGTVIGCITLGVIYEMTKQHFKQSEQEK